VEEHAVLIEFNYTADSLETLEELEEKLETAMSEADAGEYDGYDISTDLSEGVLYL
jgi:protoheme ferro-lyase